MRNVAQAVVKASRRFFGNWRSLIVFIVIYAVLILALYLFFATREATLLQLVLTFVLALVAPVLFFVVQAMGVEYMLDERNTRSLMKQSLRQFWKLILISVPFILLAWLAIYLLGKIPVEAAAAARTAPSPRAVGGNTPHPIQWKALGVSTLQFLVVYIALPVAAFHFWIATAREGLGRALRRAGHVLVSAFGPGSIAIYTGGLVVFGVIPYLLVSMTLHSKNAWVEFGLLVARLVFAALLSLFGLAITLGALTVRSRQVAGSLQQPAAGESPGIVLAN